MMNDPPEPRISNLRQLARRTHLPQAWLKAEALAGRIPCLQVGRKLLFNFDAVDEALAQRAATSRAVNQEVSERAS